MTRPFPLQVTENGKIIREVVPIFESDQLEEVYQMTIQSTPEYAETLKLREAIIKESRAVAEQLLDDPEVKAALHRSVLEKATEYFKRNLDAAGLLDENGMVKR